MVPSCWLGLNHNRPKGVTFTLIEFDDRTPVSFTGSRFGLDSSDNKDAYADSLVVFLISHTWEYHVFLT